MNEAEIRRYAELMQELGLTGLEITQGEAKVRLERSAPAGREAVYAMPDAPVQTVQNPQIGFPCRIGHGRSADLHNYPVGVFYIFINTFQLNFHCLSARKL